MSDSDIPEEIRRFIFEKIDSVLQLEALMLFLSDPKAVWRADTIGSRLYISSGQAAILLAEMKDAGYLDDRNGSYNYAPATSALAQSLQQAVETYRHNLIPVTRLIHEKPQKIRQFADAFRVRKDKP
jgi:hypothetical protein